MHSLAVNQACKRLRGSGLTQQQAHQVLNLLSRWVASCGHEWTVQRLKTLKTAYVQRMAGTKPDLPWVAHKNGVPKGPLKFLFGLKKPQKSLSSLMVYTSWRASKPTEKQVKKFTEAVTSDEVIARLTGFYEKYMLSLNRMIQEYPIPTSSRFDSVEAWSNRTGRRVPTFKESSNWRNPTGVRTTLSSREALVTSASHHLALDFFSRFEGRGRDLPNDISSLFATAAMQGEVDDVDVVGKIGFIQEPGYKLRTVASPFPVFQLQLSRLGNWSYDWLRTIREDCTFDQDGGVREIQEEMRNNGIHLMSIDLSSATDRFPYSFTEEMLEHIRLEKGGPFSKEEVRLMTLLARSDWLMPNGETIQWKNGQPLGVYPSFAIFALSHHVVARSVNPRFYRILGDDIVIDKDAGERLLKVYQDELKLKISWDKTLDSETLCEFGGRLITKDRIYATPKWASLSDRSFLDLVRNLGPTSLGLLKPRQRRVVEMLSEVPSTLHPLGLNWNPDGKPYSQRLKESEKILEALYKEDLTRGATRDRSDAVASMKESIYLRSFGDFHSATVDVGTGPNQNPRSNWSSVEDRILRSIGVESADFISGYLPAGWIPREVYMTSDPRGVPLLESLERKLQGVHVVADTEPSSPESSPSL